MSNVEEEPIGNMAWGDLEIPCEFMVKEDEKIFRIKVLSETFLTVKVRKFLLNNKEGNKYVDYFCEKDEEIYIIEELIPEQQEIIGLNKDEKE